MKLMDLIAYSTVSLVLVACAASERDSADRWSAGSAGSSFGGDAAPISGGTTGLPASGGRGAESSIGGRLEVLSAFSGAELLGFDALLADFKAGHPTLEVVHAPEQDRAALSEKVSSRLAQNMPPDLFHEGAGADLDRWIEPYPGQSRLASLDPVSKAAEWQKAFPEVVLDALSSNDGLFGVPLTIARTNVLFFSPTLVPETPYTLEELSTTASRLQAEDKQPLVFGFKTSSAATQLVFDVILPAVAGSRFRDDYLSGRASANDSKMLEALEQTVALLSFANDDRATLTESEALERVGSGAAAMTIASSSKATLLRQQGRVPGSDFSTSAAPGSSGIFVFMANVFAKPMTAPNPVAADALLAFMGTEPAQVAFARHAGALPARLGVDTAVFDVVDQRQLSDYQKDTLALSIENALAPPLLARLYPVVTQFCMDQDPEPLVAFLQANYGEFR